MKTLKALLRLFLTIIFVCLRTNKSKDERTFKQYDGLHGPVLYGAHCLMDLDRIGKLLLTFLLIVLRFWALVFGAHCFIL